MSNVPKGLRYTEEHEWITVEDGIATIGITDHAQDQLGDITFLGDLPEVGDGVDKGETIGVLESVKTNSDIYAPLTGEVVEINEDVVESPELLNSAPYDTWIVRIKVADEEELDELLTAAQYEAHTEE